MNLTLPLFDALDLPATAVAVPVAGSDAGDAIAGDALFFEAPTPAADEPTADGSADGSADGPADDGPADALGPCPAELPDPLRGVLADPGALHPSLWRASQVGGGQRAVTATGFAALDAELPGQGWPHGELTELLLAQPGIGELRLLAPALAAIGGGAGDAGPMALGQVEAGRLAGGPHGRAPPAGAGLPPSAQAVRAGAGVPRAPSPAALEALAAAGGPRCIMLFEPPAVLSAWALAQQGLDARHWLMVQARAGQRPGQRAPRTPSGLAPLLPSADLMWALEQALRSGQVGAVLAWLPSGLGPEALRRLQLAAQAHDGPVFLFREAQPQARHRPSPAPLRVLLQPAGVDGLSLRLLKRRGPPLAEPLRLALPSVLTPHQQARALAQQAVQGAVRGAAQSLRNGPRRGAVAAGR